jgi:hypothetical protein
MIFMDQPQADVHLFGPIVDMDYINLPASLAVESWWTFSSSHPVLSAFLASHCGIYGLISRRGGCQYGTLWSKKLAPRLTITWFDV